MSVAASHRKGAAAKHAPVKLIVLDRDGTLSPDPEDFVRAPEDWVPLPGALEAVARLNHGGWRVVLASNQSGLGRGLFDMATLNAVHARMHKLLAAAGGRIEAVFFCPHAPEDECCCRKPAPGLFLDIARRMGVPLDSMVAAGDSVRDVQAAAAAGCEAHLIRTGQSLPVGDGAPLPPDVPAGTQVHADLSAFADFVLARDAQKVSV
ncbi:MAG: D-glycero-beta-D-manno-heptose 1,7-bisphosphate 7-phosphatase [Macromonas sp.]